MIAYRDHTESAIAALPRAAALRFIAATCEAGTIEDITHLLGVVDDPVALRILRLWAADCAERVLPVFEQHFPGDNRPRAAVEAARPGTARAADAARAAYAAARAAYAATYAARAARAADAATYATYAADAATYAAYAADAADAAETRDQESAWQRQRLAHYLRELTRIEERAT